MIKLSQKQQFLIVSFFLLLVVIILNIRIPSKYKLSLLLLGVVICFYQPKFIIPFLTSIILVYLSNRGISNLKGKTMETFIDNNNLTQIFTNKIKTLTNSNFKSVITPNDVSNILDGNIKITENDRNSIIKTNFLKNIFKVPHFRFPEDIGIALDLGLKYNDIPTIINTLKFIDLSVEEGTEDDKFRDNKIESLSDETLKKLGLMLSQSNIFNYDNFMTSNITSLGLLSLVKGNYILDDPSEISSQIQDTIIRNSYELVVNLFFLNYREGTNRYNFNKKINLEPEKFTIVKEKKPILLDQLSLIKFVPSFISNERKKINKDNYLLELKNNITNLNIILNKYEIQNFPPLYFFPDENTLSNILYDTENTGEEKLNMESPPEVVDKKMDLFFNMIEEHIENINLMDIETYRIATKQQRKEMEFKTIENYFLMLLMTGYCDDLFKMLVSTIDVGENKLKSVLADNVLTYYLNRKNRISLQIQNEITMEEKYKFTSINDLLFDTFFYYLGLYSKQQNIFTKIIMYPELDKVIEPKPTLQNNNTKRKASINPVSDYQQEMYELELDNFLDDSNIKEKQEEALNKYYEFLDKENYEKVQGLGKLAEERNKELKIKELSFNKIVDSFGTEMFGIIDELIIVFKNFYQDNDLTPFIGAVKENFNINNTSSNSEDTTKFDKYIMLVRVIIDILLKENRILYTGFLFIMLALLIYFIDSSENYPKPQSSGIKSIFDILKL